MSERQNATGFSESEKKDDPDSLSRQEFNFPVAPIEGPPATVNVMLGLTINQGNYESARIDVGIRMPCNPADAEETYQRAKDWCESRIQIEVKSIRGR
jgi:hypothetical protein